MILYDANGERLDDAAIRRLMGTHGAVERMQALAHLRALAGAAEAMLLRPDDYARVRLRAEVQRAQRFLEVAPVVMPLERGA